ncbi:MAG: Rne/Rng family ribonuclease, partial [Alphaproteobacteria bacterium]
MAKRMLIDATHPEETRVVILSGSRLEEFDFETSTKKQIKGNIYLAKVTRVEPSLQAAFVEYGGNRHGFLAFSEIHPDYYRIPVADREALLAAQAREADDDEEESEADARRRSRRRRRGGREDERGDDRRGRRRSRAADAPGDDAPAPAGAEDEGTPEPVAENFSESAELAPAAPEWPDERVPDAPAAEDSPAAADPSRPSIAATDGIDVPSLRSDPYPSAPAIETRGHDADDAPAADRADDGAAAAEAAEWSPAEPSEAEPTDGAPTAAEPSVDEPTAEEIAGREEAAAEAAAAIETLGGDELEEVRRHRSRSIRQYKIQEVIKRRQIMLVQVTKEERGNKGAALTTYLSLAGRYCVLMPNSGRGGGVSRKIVNASDRRRLKSLIEEMQLPEGMSVIVRTAGSERSKAEIKRDLEYLLRLWDEIRELTLQSAAPALIYEEGKLIKRAIRDLYARDIEEILVEGEDAYREAKDFMRMLMPSHAKRVQPYRDPGIPLFNRFQIDQQIDAIHSPTVQLKSGGYIVINPTEALVSIDVNSGRSTRERNIEETAYRTNLEAADEIARQLRLRDLAGLIVIDFIDMEEARNQHSVERRLKEAMKGDRARIQIGRISPFGLLELSRQRLRPSIFETSTQPCPHCGGTGHIRSIESTALHVLRAIEEEGLRRRSAEIRVSVPTGVALYILNQKRAALTE